MKIYIGSDHAGFELKEEVKKELSSLGLEFEDVSPNFDENDDYPDAALAVAKKVAEEKTRGILICGTGIGMSIAANKVHGVRAALCASNKQAELTRKHNDSNILVLSGWLEKADNISEILKTWLETDFEGGRHERRVKKIEAMEEKY